MRASSLLVALMASVALAACTTNIHEDDKSIVAPKSPLRNFANVVIKPLSIDHSDGDLSDRKAINKIDKQITGCLKVIFEKANILAGPPPYPVNTLVIEPRIEDITKKSTGQRIFLGPLVGSSAVLLKTTYTNADTKETVAEPAFFAKANAWGGFFTFGATDSLITYRVAHEACDYGKTYY